MGSVIKTAKMAIVPYEMDTPTTTTNDQAMIDLSSQPPPGPPPSSTAKFGEVHDPKTQFCSTCDSTVSTTMTTTTTPFGCLVLHLLLLLLSPCSSSFLSQHLQEIQSSLFKMWIST